MRFGILLALSVTLITGCSKKDDPARTNFAELTVSGHKISFDRLEAVVDTSTYATNTELRFEDSRSNSYLLMKTTVGGRQMVKVYENMGEPFPRPTLESLLLQTYINAMPGTYLPTTNSLKVHIDKVENGRLHGTLSGKVACYSCNISGDEKPEVVNGEFELPYTYK